MKQPEEAKDGLSYYAYTSGQPMVATDLWVVFYIYTKGRSIFGNTCNTPYEKCCDNHSDKAEQQVLENCISRLTGAIASTLVPQGGNLQGWLNEIRSGASEEVKQQVVNACDQYINDLGGDNPGGDDKDLLPGCASCVTALAKYLGW